MPQALYDPISLTLSRCLKQLKELQMIIYNLNIFYFSLRDEMINVVETL